jgi:hypothetical protein
MGEGIGYYDRQGNPISFLRFGILREPPSEYPIVAKSQIGDILVSTVWLGIDHNFGGRFGSRPLIFETMVFSGAESEEIEMRRYATEDDARAGHAEVVDEVKKGLRQGARW